MSNQVNAKAGLSVKDLVTTGIFTALFVCIHHGGWRLFCYQPDADLFHARRECSACRAGLSADDRKST